MAQGELRPGAPASARPRGRRPAARPAHRRRRAASTSSSRRSADAPRPTPSHPRSRGPPVIGGRRPITGRKPGDRRVRVERPHSPYFRYTGPNQLVAKARGVRPAHRRSGDRCVAASAWLLGRPLASEDEIGERLSKRLALPDLQLGRDLVVGLRDGGDPAGAGRRRRGGVPAQSSRWRSRSPSCSPWSRCRTARCAAPSPTAVAPMPSRGPS